MKQHARPELAKPDLLELLKLDDEGFQRYFAGTPILRARRRGLLRNVCVALGNVGSVVALPALEQAAHDPDPLIAEHAQWATELLKEFRLLPGQRIGRLSKGENAKLMMLLALCQKPDLLVLDEPMDGLDPVIRRDVLSALLDYVSSHGATVFVSSHLVHELERFCDWIGVMDRGRLVVELPMGDFRSGNKRIRLAGNGVLEPAGAPFTLLARQRDAGSAETWVVRGWRPEMVGWFERGGVAIREVADLDLEDGFVELLRAFRARE